MGCGWRERARSAGVVAACLPRPPSAAPPRQGLGRAHRHRPSLSVKHCDAGGPVEPTTAISCHPKVAEQNVRHVPRKVTPGETGESGAVEHVRNICRTKAAPGAEIWPQIRPTLANDEHFGPTFGRIWPESTKLGQTLAEFGQILAKLDQCMPLLVELCRSFSKF